MLHGRVQDSGPTTEEKQTIAMEYAQRVYDGEYDTAGESVRKANMPVHLSCLVLLTLSLGYIISIKKSNQINIGPHEMRGNKACATRAQTISLFLCISV